MQQKECMIIRDLLPSYIEQLTSDNTNQVVEQHLQECRKCRDLYQELLADYEGQQMRKSSIDRKFWCKLRRYRCQLLGTFLGVILTFLLLVGLAYWGIWSLERNNSVNVYTERIEDYREFEDYMGLSRLSLFPSRQQLAQSDGSILKYVYDCSGSKLYQNCQIYMECEYTAEEYQKEVDRLSQFTYSQTGRSAEYSENGYEYPAVYAIKNVDGCNEYVLFLEEEQKIIYIYLQGVVDRRDLHFEEQYLPLDYGQNGMTFEEVESYSIYPIEEWINYEEDENEY